MGKKRRPSGKASVGSTEAGLAASEPRAKLNVRSYEDVADSEDEFYLNQDKVLLDEGPARKKLRKLNEEGEYSCSVTGFDPLIASVEAFFQPSDEEVLSVPDSDEDSNEDVNQDAADEDDLDDEALSNRRSKVSRDREGDSEDDVDLSGWGESKRDYYDADLIETEADALEEEKEALRLQRKQLKNMSVADYGFDEADWLQGGDDAGEAVSGGIIQEVLPELTISDSMTEDEKAKVLSTRYPEFGPLSQEFMALQPVFEELDAGTPEALESAEAATRVTDGLAPAVAKRNILASYLGSLAMYFALLSAGVKAETGKLLIKSPAEMRDHPIMETLITTRGLWEKVKDMAFPDHTPIMKQTKDDLPARTDAPSPAGSAPLPAPTNSKASKRKKSRKSKAQLEAEQALQEADAIRNARLQRMQSDLAKISAPVLSKPSRPFTFREAAKPDGSDSSDFGEAPALTPDEAAAKAQRKRNLRFHTAKLTAKSLKRDRATRDGGDADLPYRERLIDRAARLTKAAEKRGARAAPETALDEADSDDDDRAARSALRTGSAGDDAEDYYDLVAARAQAKKSAKAADAAAREEARIAGRVPDDAAGSGKRELTYQIATNKGLAPHRRNKDARNPRIKKKKQFEKRTKRLVNLRPVYKGGEGPGGYGGEKTGIRTNLVKSTKL